MVLKVIIQRGNQLAAVMKMHTLIAVLLCLTTGCGSVKDEKKLQGEWLKHATYGEFDFCTPLGMRSVQVLTFNDGNFTYKCPGTIKTTFVTGTFTCDATKNPKQITFKFDGRTVVAIYDISSMSGDQLQICVGEHDDVPPTEFDGGAPRFKSSRPAVLIFDRAPKPGG